MIDNFLSISEFLTQDWKWFEINQTNNEAIVSALDLMIMQCMLTVIWIHKQDAWTLLGALILNLLLTKDKCFEPSQ